GCLAAAPLRPQRRRIDEDRLGHTGARFALLVTHGLQGGVERFVQGRSREALARGLIPLQLKPCATRDRFQLCSEALPLQDLQFDIPAELPAFRSLIASLQVEHVEIHHFLNLDPRILETVRSLGRPYDVYLHDYVWICP